MLTLVLISLLIPAMALTAPPSKAPTEWKVALISDMNQSYGSTAYRESLKAAVAHITAAKTAAVISTGDMVAGQKKGLDYKAMWNSFNRHVTEPLQKEKIPLLPSAGNHDASTGASFEKERGLYVDNFNAYKPDRFKDSALKFLPGTVQSYPLYYAMTLGPALFIALDATASGPLIGDQLTWLESVLKKSKDHTIKIVFGHVPLYPFAFDRAHESLSWGDAAYATRLEKLLQAEKVTYYFSGHHHVFYPGRRAGHARFVSVPLLGTGRRRLLTRDRSHRGPAPEGFLYLHFNDRGEHRLEALTSPELTPINWEDLPPEISIPARSARDCKGCGDFPSGLFLDLKKRSVFERLKK